MDAVICHHGELRVEDRPDPVPGKGQVRLEVIRCGICGSDLHARHGMDQWADLVAPVAPDGFMRSDRPIVFGHEFSGRLAEHGPGCKKELAEGTPVVAVPLLRGSHGVAMTGLSEQAPGAYAEQVLAEESLLLEVPNGLDPELATLTEPLSVAWHAVRRGEVGKRDVAIVIGCGPVGLAVILCLKAQGVRTVVAANRSPGRRALAQACGADVVVDPTKDSPYEAVTRKGTLADWPSAFELVVSTREKLGRLPVGWWHLWRLGEKLGALPKRPVIFECVGAPGVIDSILEGAPLYSRVVVVGYCVAEDRFRPGMGISKEIDLRFVFGYTPLEFRDTLHNIADGKIDVRPLLTGTVGLEGVESAFDALSDPERHAKILIDPRSPAAAP
jgi:threonine dehydrogenase-like Zn-dependent dehydrogenase